MKIAEKILAFILFILCIVFPFYYYFIKLPILAYFIFRITLTILYTQKINISLNVLILFAIYVFAGLFFIFYGFYTDFAYEGSLKYVLALYVGFPIIYFLIILGIPKRLQYIVFFERILNIGIIAVSLVMITAFLNKKYGYFNFLEFIFNNMIVDLRDNVVKINYHGISSLLFLFPFFFTKNLFNNEIRTARMIISKIIVLLIAFFAVSLSGRRALLVLFVLSIVIAFGLKLIYYPKIKRTINKNIILLSFIGLVFMSPFLISFNYGGIIKKVENVFAYAFNFDNNKSSKASDNERIKQINQFIEQIKQRPILGYGHGASLENVVRSTEKPWRYEMSYFSIIFHTGFVGFSLYILGPLWILLSLLNIAGKYKEHKAMALAIFNGLLAMFIAFFTNPYLDAFDIQWVIYLPIFFILIVSEGTKKIVNAS